MISWPIISQLQSLELCHSIDFMLFRNGKGEAKTVINVPSENAESGFFDRLKFVSSSLLVVPLCNLTRGSEKRKEAFQVLEFWFGLFSSYQPLMYPPSDIYKKDHLNSFFKKMGDAKMRRNKAKQNRHVCFLHFFNHILWTWTGFRTIEVI